MTTPARIPDWFDRLWHEYSPKLPVLLRTDSAKKIAREIADVAIREFAKQAGTPEGVRAIIAYAKISAILKGTRGVCDAPDPTPEEVTEAVKKLVERLKVKP